MKTTVSKILRFKLLIPLLFLFHLLRWFIKKKLLWSQDRKTDFCLNEFFNLLGNPQVLYCIAPGKSASELSYKQLVYLKNHKTFSISGAFIFFNSPTILFYEVSLISLDDRAFRRNDYKMFLNLLDNFKDQLNKSKTLIIIGLPLSESRFRNYILARCPGILKTQIRFVSVFEFPSVNENSLEICFKIAKKISKILYHFNTVPFSRTSASVPLLLSSLYSNSFPMVLIGYDGTGGKPENTYAYSEAIKGVINDSDKNLDKKIMISDDYGIHDKNSNSILHSTNNPAYGLPTLSQILTVINKRTVLLVSSNTSLFSKFLKVCHIPEWGNDNS